MLEGLKGMAGLASVLKDLPKIKARMEQVKERLGEMQRAIRFRLVWARESGEIGEDKDVEALTAFYSVMLQGLLMSSRVAKDKAAMKQAGAVALSLLD